MTILRKAFHNLVPTRSQSSGNNPSSIHYCPRDPFAGTSVPHPWGPLLKSSFILHDCALSGRWLRGKLGLGFEESGNRAQLGATGTWSVWVLSASAAPDPVSSSWLRGPQGTPACFSLRAEVTRVGLGSPSGLPSQDPGEPAGTTRGPEPTEAGSELPSGTGSGRRPPSSL